MNGEIDFESGAPIWMMEAEHSAGITGSGTPYPQGVFFRTVQAESEEEAIKEFKSLFEATGMNLLHIQKIWTTRLERPRNVD